MHKCPETFGNWADANSNLESMFADFPVAFRHPHNGHPVFNLSDPGHITKKTVNALWHSDKKDSERNLGMYMPHPETGEDTYSNFSLNTLKKVYDHEELALGGESREDQVAEWTRFRSLTPEQFSRNSHNCMNVGLSNKVGVVVLLAPL